MLAKGDLEHSHPYYQSEMDTEVWTKGKKTLRMVDKEASLAVVLPLCKIGVNLPCHTVH